MPKYVVTGGETGTSGIEVDGKRYEPGETVEIAAGLLKQDGNVVSVLVNNTKGSSDTFLDLQLESTGP